MKLTEKLAVLPTAEEIEARKVRKEQRRPEIEAERKAALAYRVERERRIARAYEALNEADKMLALATRLPATREERVALANELRIRPNGARRRYWEIAGIMGVPLSTVGFYFQDPAGVLHRVRRGEARTPTPTKKPVNQSGLAVENAGERVRRIRKLLGLSQHALAEQLGVSKTTIQSWETEKRRPSLSAYQAVLNLLREG